MQSPGIVLAVSAVNRCNTPLVQRGEGVYEITTVSNPSPYDNHLSSRTESPTPRPSAATKAMAVLLLLVAAALVFVVLQDRRPAPAPATGAATTYEARAVTPRGDLSSQEQSTIELFSNASPSVVHVKSVEKRRSLLSLNVFEIPQGSGSGFLWDKEGHVVTNYHVIQSGTGAEVILHDNSVWPAKIIGRAPDKDLAVLKIEAPADKLRPLAIGTSDNLLVGQAVFAIGNPFGLDQTLTTGVISGLGREIQSVTRRPIKGVVQTDAAINPGNSGGPLLDSAGRLLGVNTAIYSPSGAYAGIGFAVPVDTVHDIVPQLIAHGRVVRPGLGIHIGADNFSRKWKIKGVVVIDVPEGSAAANSGLIGTRADNRGRWVLGDIIVGINGQPVRVMADLFGELDKFKVGDQVTLEVENAGKRRSVEIVLQDLN